MTLDDRDTGKSPIYRIISRGQRTANISSWTPVLADRGRFVPVIPSRDNRNIPLAEQIEEIGREEEKEVEIKNSTSR